MQLAVDIPAPYRLPTTSALRGALLVMATSYSVPLFSASPLNELLEPCLLRPFPRPPDATADALWSSNSHESYTKPALSCFKLFVALCPAS